MTAGLTYTGDGVSGLSLYSPQLEVGPAAPYSPTPYQRVTTMHDVTEAGIPDLWHLYNDSTRNIAATIPAGSYELAWRAVGAAPGFLTFTIAAAGPVLLMRNIRTAAMILRQGTFTTAERSRITSGWAL